MIENSPIMPNSKFLKFRQKRFSKDSNINKSDISYKNPLKTPQASYSIALSQLNSPNKSLSRDILAKSNMQNSNKHQIVITTNAKLRFQMLRKNFTMIRKNWSISDKGSNKNIMRKVKYNNSFNVYETHLLPIKEKQKHSAFGVYGCKDNFINYFYKNADANSGTTRHYHAYKTVNSKKAEMGIGECKINLLQIEQGIQANFENPIIDAPILCPMKSIDNSPKPFKKYISTWTQTGLLNNEDNKNSLKKENSIWLRYKELADKYVKQVFKPINPRLLNTKENSNMSTKSYIKNHIQFQNKADNDSYIIDKTRTVKTSCEKHRSNIATKRNSSSKNYEFFIGVKREENINADISNPDIRAQKIVLEKKSDASFNFLEYEQKLISNTKRHKRNLTTDSKIYSQKNNEIQAVKNGLVSIPEKNNEHTSKENTPSKIHEKEEQKRKKIQISLSPLDPMLLKKEDSYYSTHNELDPIWTNKKYSTPKSGVQNFGYENLVKVDTPKILKSQHKKKNSVLIPRNTKNKK